MLPEYRPEPVKTDSYRKVIVLMLIATVTAAAFFLLKPKPTVKLADYKLQYKIEEPIITSVKNDTRLIEELKNMSKDSGKKKLSKHIDELVVDRKDELEKELAVTVSDRVVKNANTVINQRLSEYVWKQDSIVKRPRRRYIPGPQRPMSPTRQQPIHVYDGATNKSNSSRNQNAAKSNNAAGNKPSKTGIPSQESR